MSIENKDSYRVGITPNEKEKIEILTSRNNFINAVAIALNGWPISFANAFDCSGVVGGSEFDSLKLALKQRGIHDESELTRVRLENYQRLKKPSFNNIVIDGAIMLSNVEFHISSDKIVDDRVKIFYGIPIKEQVERYPTVNDYKVLGEIGKFIKYMMERYGDGIFRGVYDEEDDEDGLYTI
ncbi:MAG: hypothetical protein NTZ20_04115 [Candidatus Levybacteria bacterium]|nr:hypothetical protein [Candidatus Levybacteria bacterium]MSU26204.1 hypothetical protein [Candidatus Levybacteria bacterium]